PVIGLVQVGMQAWAERYTYLPGIGLALALVWGADACLASSAARRGVLGLAALALGALAWSTTREPPHLRDSTALFERALAVDGESPVAHVNLGNARLAAGDLAGAERHYARALELAPALATARVNRAQALRLLGRADEARAELERALAEAPDLGTAHAEL